MPNIRELPPLDPDAPPVEPVTLAEARAQVRVDEGADTDDDATLLSLITAARQAAESFTERLFTSARYELRVDAFHSSICLPNAPVAAIESMQYLDEAAVLTTLDPALYFFDDHPDAPRLVAAAGAVFPTTLAMPGSVRVRFTGPDPEALPVPRAVVHAMLLTIGHLYENRQAVVVNGTAVSLPHSTQALLWPYRRGLGV